VKVLEGGCVCLENGPSSSKLLIVPVDSQTLNVELVTGDTDPIQGWFSLEHHQKTPATAIIFECRQTAATVLTTLLYPVPESGPDEGVTIRSLALKTGDGNAFVVQGKTFRDHILISDNEGLKSIGQFQTRERVCVVRTPQAESDPWGLSTGQCAS
jgi:hypothetical protein